MTINLIYVLKTVSVPVDEVYVGFIGKNELADRLIESVSWRSF